MPKSTVWTVASKEQNEWVLEMTGQTVPLLGAQEQHLGPEHEKTTRSTVLATKAQKPQAKSNEHTAATTQAQPARCRVRWLDAKTGGTTPWADECEYKGKDSAAKDLWQTGTVLPDDTVLST